MSQPLSDGDVLKVTVVCVGGPQVSLTSFYFKVDSHTGASVTDQFAANAFDTNFNVGWKAIISNDSTYQGFLVQKIFPLPIFRRRTGYSNTGIGNGGVGTLPTQTSGLARIQSDTAGRTGRGRVYLPFPSKAVSSSSIPPVPLNLVYVSPANAVVGGIVATQVLGIAPDTATLKPIIWHRKTQTFTDLPINAATVIDTWATTRRRGALGRANTIPF